MKELSSLDSGSTKKKAVTLSLNRSNLGKEKLSLHPVYATFFALLLFIFELVLYKKYPLGDDSFLLSDLGAQYAPYLTLIRSKIFGLGGIPKEQLLSYISYSFKLGLGKNLLGTFGYYLASPVNLIILLFDESQIDFAVLTIIGIKLCLASGFMCLFLEKRFNEKKKLWPVVFGLLYAFATYSRLFIFNIMWLDGYMLLPLVLYFSEKFIEKRKYTGLVISLLILFISNYYIAYMVGIASFLYLCVRMYELEIPLKKALGICVRYILTAGFTGMITAVLLVPVGLDTIRNADQTISNHSDFLITHSPLAFMHMFIMGDPRDFDILSSNYPLILISLSITILMLIYFFSPVFKGREKKAHIFCAIGIFLSIVVFEVDKAWQVFDEPNWFQHRYVFVFLPFFLIISYRVLEKIKDVAKKDIVKVTLILYLLTVIDYSFGVIQGKNDILVYNIVLITAYSAIFLGFGFEKWPEQLKDMSKILAPLYVCFICFELAFVGHAMYSSIDSFTMREGSAKELGDSIKAEKEFGNYARNNNLELNACRAETFKTIDYTVEYYVQEGEAFYGNYNGISFFNSNSNKKMHHFMKQLGYDTNFNYFAVTHSYPSPLVDSFFSVGSMSSREELDYYNLEGEDSIGTGLKFYSNENALPLAFAVDKGASDFDFYRLERDAEEKNYFALQNEWYRSLFPDQFTDDVYKEIGEDVIGEQSIINGVSFNTNYYTTHRYLVNKESQTGEESQIDDSKKTPDTWVDPLGLEGSVQNELEYNITDLYRINEKLPIVIEYEFKAPSDGDIYCSLVTGQIMDGVEVYVNGVLVYKCDSDTNYSLVVRLGNFAEGDDVKVTLLSNKKQFSFLNIRFASFDNETFKRQIAVVDKTKVEPNTVTDGYAKLSINNLDTDETVITTIPVEEGWQLYIDGEPAEYKIYQNAFISFDVGSGSHTAELVFTAPGLKAGALISCVGVVSLAAFVLVDKYLSKKKKVVVSPAA